MSTIATMQSPAVEAAQRAEEQIVNCIKDGKSFRLEAGAGAGKTYSLIEALKWLIANQGKELQRNKQKIACVTYTNVAVEEILSRIDCHPVVAVSTIHAFCWSLMSPFQPYLRTAVPTLDGWSDRLTEAGAEIGMLRIEYELGHPSINDERVSLGHNDVITLVGKLLGEQKFREVFVAKFPVLFIDEYQDTNKVFAAAIAEHFLNKKPSPLIGFFGDHWQKIYPDGCGRIDNEAIVPIDKGANFRSVPAVVEFLNKLRPELPQAVKDPHAKGSAVVYHTNDWVGARRTENHWQEDLPAVVAHEYLQKVFKRLATDGWAFDNPKKTKILMLTNALLAQEQAYASFLKIFKYPDSYLNKENAFIKFFVETVEPMSDAFVSKRYGEMFAAVGGKVPVITSHADKQNWANDMNELISLRKKGTIGDVLAHLEKTRRPQLPEGLLKQMAELAEYRTKRNEESNPDGEDSRVRRLGELDKLLAVPYKELSALREYIDDKTPFSTKHGVKGQEFDDVLVVFGRGWNQYNFNQMLEWYNSGVPTDKQGTFERNRNLFYVSCSRSKRRLVLFFTQKLSPTAVSKLESWLGKASVISLGAESTK